MLSRVGFLRGHPLKSLVQPRFIATSSPLAKDACATGTDENKPNKSLRLVRQEPGKVRMGFVPEEWFTFFYKKTGVTGPYTFGVGLTTYLVSKEFYVLEHEFYTGISIFIMVVYCIKKFGAKVAAYLDKEIDTYEASLNLGRKTEKENLEEQLKDEERAQWSSDGQLVLVEAKRENVHLQLEAEYRHRQMTVYDQVKRYLDYQLERQGVERRIAQKNLVGWVLNQVTASITSEQEKQNIDKCIADLGVLAKA